jgi:hypothetical protein
VGYGALALALARPPQLCVLKNQNKTQKKLNLKIGKPIRLKAGRLGKVIKH